MRLLLVEDSARFRETIALGLGKAGFVLDVAGDGQEALWRAESADYDLIILDIMLPKMDGLTVLRKLRAAGNQTHVLMLTVKDTVEDRVEGLRAGADDYLPKPFSFDELLARVEALVRRKYGTKDRVVKVGDLEIDTAARLVRRGKREITLTPREYRMLEFLARKQGQVVSRTEIEAHVYSDEKDVFSNAVESAMSVLRRKLALPGCKPIIHTRRGMGYVLQTS